MEGKAKIEGDGQQKDKGQVKILKDYVHFCCFFSLVGAGNSFLDYIYIL